MGATYDELLAVARRTEETGFDAFFRSDHYLTMGGDGLPGPTDAWVTLAGLARETSRIRLGTLMSAATFRLPGPLAISVAQVDQMSGGLAGRLHPGRQGLTRRLHARGEGVAGRGDGRGGGRDRRGHLGCHLGGGGLLGGVQRRAGGLPRCGDPGPELLGSEAAGLGGRHPDVGQTLL